MTGKYDETMKKFVGANPIDFTDWLFSGAIFDCILPTELQSRNIFADVLCKVTLNGEPALLEIEFQRSVRKDVPDRVLEYNVLASRQHNLRVYSCVIYLIDEGTIEESPLLWELPDGHQIIRFDYLSIRMCDVDPAKLRKPGREGILPLVILTRGNARPAVVDEVIERLRAAGKHDLLPPTEMLASLAFKDNPVHTEWLKRRFKMLRDILRDTEPYQRILEEGRAEGLEEGEMKGREEGALQQARATFLEMAQESFPALRILAQAVAENVSDPAVLKHLTIRIGRFSTEEKAQQLLVDIIKEQAKKKN
ncbi:MAG: Rpn family recombination-promoting nuclease/putative transposase [Chloroflexi bacterium]|nr:Rpn family recombination-promoting nuclease/putative transposase [Chloroflexota bacterium]